MIFKRLISILKNFRKKYRLNFRDPYTDEETWHIYVSAFNVVAGMFAFILIMFIVIASSIAYTPLLDLLPGHLGSKSGELLVRNIIKLDSLEQEVRNWREYRENIALIMEGKTPVSLSASASDTVSRQKKEILTPSRMDSLLRRQMEGSGPYSLENTRRPGRSSKTTLDLFPPIQGIVTRPFDPASPVFGIDITASTGNSVLSVLDGTVLMSIWTPSDGFVIQIQHAGNLISIYKNLSQLIRKQGDRVRAGEIIGYVGNRESDAQTGTLAKPYLHFELWYNGSAIAPEDYITF